MTTGKHLKCVVVTPEEAVLDETTDLVVVPMYDGELGILPGHTPLIGRLGAGELRLKGASGLKRYFVDGGFVQVRSDEVTLLTQKAIAAGDIDATKVEAQVNAPMPHAKDLAAQEAATKAKVRARAMLHVARKI
jgi:F-type H+-transporting ATPase subunit epsilon